MNILSLIKRLVCSDCIARLKLCEETNEKLSQSYDKLLKKYRLLLKQNMNLNEQLQKALKQIKFLRENNKAFLYDLNFDKINMTLKEVSPYDFVLPNINLICADLNYYAIKNEEWEQIFQMLYNAMQNYVYEQGVFDCDDFAFLSNAIIMYNCYKYGLKKQLAFGIAWSDVHAFNVFIAQRNGKFDFFIYEPQTGEIVSRMLNGTGDYKVKRVMFLV